MKSANLNQVHVVRVMLSVENGISSQHSIETSAIQLGTGQVRDIKFFDDSNLFVLWDLEGTLQHPQP
tara:strand:- start:195 stop:395 length:201 start_codon:yes stop_codon:yes gene_type:complete